MGRSLEETVNLVCENYGVKLPTVNEVSKLMFAHEFNLIKENILSIDESLLNLIDEAKSEGIKIGVVTSNYKYRAKEILNYLNLLSSNGSGSVDVLVARDDVINPKPNPEPFLKAANMLNLIPSRCVAFDDSPYGIISAKKAGMLAAYKLTDRFEVYSFDEEVTPEIKFESFNELDLNKLDWSASYYSGHF